MSKLVDVKVPDIGDFHDIPVIEVLVKPGDSIQPEDTLVTLESDKATLEVPSPAAGVVKDLKIKVGDKVSEGTLLLTLEAEQPEAKVEAPSAKAPAGLVGSAPQQAKEPSAPPAEKAPETPPAAGAAPPTEKADIHAEVVVLGAGPGGYTAAFRAADLGKKTVLVERYPTLGGVCLNVGCIPSKALLHVAKVITEAEEMAHAGVAFGKPQIHVAKLREWKAGVVGKLTKGLAGLAKQRKVQVVQGRGEFASAHTLRVETSEGPKTIAFDHCIIAAGSSVARIPGFPYEDKRIFDSTGALELPDIPKRLLVVGGGIIGL
ncbi:MAG: FAD-dependent oxidoreductase, partial [Burkholderiales bacterium]